jgi:hypothetical protein
MIWSSTTEFLIFTDSAADIFSAISLAGSMSASTRSLQITVCLGVDSSGRLVLDILRPAKYLYPFSGPGQGEFCFFQGLLRLPGFPGCLNDRHEMSYRRVKSRDCKGYSWLIA